ncbi:G1 family glutamic endopeptidase [Nakamurella lactea]|uniref:G1 family glutamic endopeptidase n=1 Tax=Nakamurella lactea TaxID=459515 RepID=UPI002ADE7D24|nr:G1 family glutamic endopeptidase [Nakamurella lactea]
MPRPSSVRQNFEVQIRTPTVRKDPRLPHKISRLADAWGRCRRDPAGPTEWVRAIDSRRSSQYDIRWKVGDTPSGCGLGRNSHCSSADSSALRLESNMSFALASGLIALAIGTLGAPSVSSEQPSLAPGVQRHTAVKCPAGSEVRYPAHDGPLTSGELAELGVASGSSIYEAARKGSIRWVREAHCGKPIASRSHGVPPKRPARQVTPNAIEATSDNWDGYVMAVGGTPNDAEMNWTEPTLLASADGLPTDVSIWPGLGSGSDANHPLIQAGTHGQIGDNSPGATQKDWLWTEIYPQEDEIPVMDIQVYGGSQVFVAATYDPDEHNAHFVLCADGVCITLTRPAVSPDSQAEWIVERPSYTTYSRLAHFPTLTLENDAFNYRKPDGSYPGTGVLQLSDPPYFGGDTLSRMTMISTAPDQHHLAEASAVSGGAFDATWVGEY